MEKKVYVTPEVTKVEFDGSDRITASILESSCGAGGTMDSMIGC